MQALVFDKAKYSWETSKGFELAEVPEPKLEKDDEIIIKVRYAGVCGTDKSLWHRQAFGEQILESLAQENVMATPNGSRGKQSHGKEIAASRHVSGLAMTGKSYRILGHELGGEIVEVGKAVKDLRIGDFVSCESHIVCNQCFQCRSGQKNVCVNEKILGITRDGCFAEYLKVPARTAWKTNLQKIRPEVAAIQEPFGNAVHAASKVLLKGRTIAVFGLGPIGLFTVLVARGLGAGRIIGVELKPEAIAMAKALGVDEAIRQEAAPSGVKHNPEIVQKILSLTDGRGVDVAFEMAGPNAALNNAIFSARRGGDVILFGIRSGDFVLEDYNRLIVRGLTLHAVIGRQIWQTWEITKKLLEDSANGIQEKIFKIILNRGEGTTLPIREYDKERFEQMMTEHPKFLIHF